MKRLCITCQEPIQGRKDKKFCDDACRSNFHYLHQNTDQEFIKQVNQILKNNRKILQRTLNRVNTNKELLSSLGYDFNYFTHSNLNESGQKQFFCYEYGYIELNHKQIQVIKKKEHQHIPTNNPSRLII